MEEARVPDFVQMHTGALEESEIGRFAGAHPEIEQWQICRLLNLDNSQVMLGGCNLLDSTQDNGLCVQSENFNFLYNVAGMDQPDSGTASSCDRILYLLDGRIATELSLGRLAAGEEKQREEKVARWLMGMGW